MAVRTLGSLPRRLAALCLAVFLGQSASVPLLAGGGGQGGAAKGKPDTLAEQTLSAEVPARLEGDSERDDEASPATLQDNDGVFEADGRPREQRLLRSHSWDGDLRSLPQTEPVRRERPEREGPDPAPRLLPGIPGIEPPPSTRIPIPSQNPPAPPTSQNFDGLDFANFGAGHPPDTNGDVGPNHYIQTINTSIGIYNKTGTRLAAFSFDTFMSQGAFGNICDTENFGDPVVLYDTFEDRWVITDFAFVLGGGGQVVPPALQCVAVSKTGNPVSGGWNFYSIETLGGLGDYPKFGVWPDGIYMSANMFSYQAGGGFQGARVWAFNKAQMYAGSPTVQVVSFNVPGGDFTVLPSNARLQAGTPPAGRPNYFLSSWQFLNALTVYKFHVNWQNLTLSTFTGPDTPIAATSWPNAGVPNASSQGGNNLDVLQIRAMMQNQYSNIGGAESLWAAHTVRRQDLNGFAAPRWYQVNVTGGTVAPAIPQAATWDPDGANTMYRFMPSLAVNRNGDMALGYSTSSSTTKPAIKYAGRLAADPVNTLSQTEQVLIQGTGTQFGLCGASACTRWGDYSAMTLDPDGCTFWYTNMYYAVDGLNHLTRVGAFTLPGCTTVGNGTLTGTVTNSVSTAPIAGATVALGSRTTTTDGSGVYTFAVPAGTYPSVTASSTGFSSSTNTGIVVSDGSTTTQDFALSPAATTGCNTDTTQGHFQAGISSNCDLNASPGDVNLLDADTIVQNINLGTSGVGITTATWGGQTFTATATAPLTKVDISLFCSACSGAPPPLTLSVRATTGGLPSGADLASATIPGFLSGASAYYTATFGTPPMLTSGTMYALVIHPNVNPTGTYALTRSGTSGAGNDVHASGTRVLSTTSGATWSIPTTGGITTDAGFKAYLHTGFPASGTFVSSLKDANPSAGAVPHWSTLSWTASTPAGTNVQFQAAASNIPGGPFNFVGPDGTTATFFTSGGSLAQFNGKRYLKYQASLTTSSPTATPALNGVTVCFQDVPTTTTAITSDTPDSSVFGAPVAVTYTVTANAPSGNTITGNVVVTDGVDMCTATVAAGGCTLTLHTVGSRILTATYQGDPNFLASPPSVGEPHGVSKADTTASITADPTDPSVVGQAVTISYAVAVNAPGSGTPTGTVTVTDGVASCTGTLPALSCSITLTTPGAHNLTATYNGDASFNASPVSAVEPHSVSKADTTAAITGDTPDPSVTGAPVLVTYTVTVDAPGSGTPTGTVTVTDGVASCTGTLPALSCSITLTGVGTHNLTATYNGDASFNASPVSAVEPHTVNKADTTAAITSDTPDPSVTGAPVLVTYTVTVNAPGNGTPTGTVTVTDGVASCTGTLPALSCSITLATPGAHNLTATYNGDASFNASPVSAVEPHTVNKADTTAAITGDTPDPSVTGAPVLVTYTVTVNAPGNGTPTGTVTVTDGVASCTGTLPALSCSITLSTAGSHNLTATYNGDASFNASPASAAEPHTVAKANTTAAITGDSPDPSAAGQAVTVTYTVAVDPPGSGTPTGNVTVTDGTDSCTGTVAAGTCSITLTTVGSRMLTATYEGNANFNASPASAGEPHTVRQATTTTITGSAPNPSFPGQAVTVNYTVVVNPPPSGTPTGNVTVTDGVDSCTATVAAGSCVITFSTSGPRVVTASYAGDASFASSTSAPFSQIVLFPNNTAALAKDVLIGSVSTDTLGPVPQDHNFFRYRATAGRSYCVEVDNGRTETTVLDTFLSVYHADGTTPIGTNDNIADEPGGPLLSRVCYIAAVSEDNLADVTSALGGNPGVFRVRVVDTTTFAPWFFASGNVEAFILVKNTTGAAHNVTVTLLGATGAPATAPQSGVMPANGSYNLQVSAPPPGGFGLTSVSGGVLIAHDGPPGAVGATVTSIDFVSGVSFDTPSSPRQDPRR